MWTEAQVLATEMEVVNKKMPTLFDRDGPFFATIERRGDVQKVSNREMRVPLEIRPGGLFGHFDPDGGDLGLGEGPEMAYGTVPVVHLKIGFEWTKKAEWATDDARKAVINAFRHLMANAMKEFRRHVDSLCMTSGNGVVATVSAASNAASVTTVTAEGTSFGVRLLRFGQPISIVDPTFNTMRAITPPKKITFYDAANRQIKYADGALNGVVAGDFILVDGLTASGGTAPTSVYGVKYHNSDASTGTWLNMSRANNPEIRGNRVNAAGALALAHARLALSKAGERMGSDATRKMTAWMHPAQLAAYEQLAQLVTVINSSGKAGSFDPYYNEENMRIAGVKIRTSYSWDKARIDFIPDDTFGRAEMHPISFYTVDGRRIFERRGSSGGVYTSQIFYITYSFQLFATNPGLGAYIDGLTAPSGF